MRKRKKESVLRRGFAMLLAVMLLCGSVSIPAMATDGTLVPETISGWAYSSTTVPQNKLDESDSLGATTGTTAAKLWLEGATYTKQVTKYGLATNTWAAGNGAWYMRFNAVNYQNLTFSATLRSSKDGPKNFQLEYLLDGENEWKEVSNSKVEIADAAGGYKDGIALPNDLDKKSFTLRIRQINTVSVSGSTEGSVKDGGASNINDIAIKGVKTGNAPTTPPDSTTPTEPTTPTTPTPPATSGTDIGSLINELKAGDTFVMYNPKNKMVMVPPATGANLTGKVVEVNSTDNTLPAPDEAVVLTASVDANGKYSFTSGGKYLTTGATGGNLTMADAASDFSLWELKSTGTAGEFYVKSVNAVYTSASGSKSPQYIEYYNGFTAYSLSDANLADSTKDKSVYVIKFYRAAKPADGNYTVDTNTVLTMAQWAGNANYAEAGAGTAVKGDLYKTNDMKDDASIYSAVVGGKNVQTYTEGTTGGNTTYYMGGTGLGSGNDDYVQLALSSAGYANMNLSFRLRASKGGAGSYQLKYSTDGTNFAKFTTGEYSYKYTSYGSDGKPSDVSNAGTITDGIAKTSYAPTYYINFSFKVPKAAENAEKLYIRLVPGKDKASGATGTPDTGGTLRMDSVVLTGSPAVSDGICGYVKANPASGEASVGTPITLTSSTEGAVIYYSVDGGADQIYDGNAKPILDKMPTNIRVYAKKSGLKDSIKVTYSYATGKVKTVKAAPNGGAVLKDTKLTLTCATAGAKILYSEDEGATWKDYSETDKLTLSAFPKSYQVKAIKEGYEDSDVLTLSYTERTSAKYNIYFGQLHSHTSYSDGAGSADSAFKHAKDEVDNLDYLAVTDHSNSFDNEKTANINDGSMSTEWVEGHQLADKYTDKDFVGIMGYEMTWSNGLGHMNTFNSGGFQSRTQTDYSTYSTALQNYYAALKRSPNSISQFNHPGTTFGDFSDFAYYDEENDKLITTIEVGNGEGAIGSSGYFPSYQYYQRALDKGWHVAPTNNQDNHKGLWGDSNTARSVVLADSLTRENVYDAMRNYRVYATEDNDLSIYYTLDGYEMGSILTEGQTGDTVNIKAELKDPTDKAIGKVQVITNGGLVLAEKYVESNEETVEFTVDNKYSYYYLKIVEGDSDIAVTAPVWVGEVEAAGINSFTTDEVLPVQGQSLTATVELYNNEDEAMKLNSIRFMVDGNVVHTADLEGKGLTSIPAMGSGTYSFDYTYDKVGSMEITAIVNATLKGAPKIYESNLKLSYVTPEMVTKVIIDGTHYNDYVTGYYGANMGNFTKIAGQKNVKVEVVPATDKITAEKLKGCSLLVVSAPARGNGTANAGEYKQSEFDPEFIEAVKAYVQDGGSVAVCGLADYQDTKQSDSTKHASAQLNKLLEAIGSTMRINDDEVYDTENNGGQAYRLYPSIFNMESKWTQGIITSNDNPDNYQKYSQYSGCTVNPGSGTWLVKGFDTTYSIDSDKDGVGNNGESDSTNQIVMPKGNVIFLASEDTAAGGTVFAAGGVFLSDFEVKAEIDNPDDLPYANRTIAENILDAVTVELPSISIAEFRKKGMGEVGAIEGYVTAGTSNEYNKFFDAIYVQDDTAGITVFPYAELGLEIGTKIKITGYVDAYQGDKEIQVMKAKVLKDAEPKIYEPVRLSAAEAMNYEANGGRLVRVEGKVTRVLAGLDSKSKASGGVSQFWIDDGSGKEANIFIDGYINSGTTGKNELAEFVKKGARVSAVGLVYAHPEGESDEPVICLRVRNVDEITPIWADQLEWNDILDYEVPEELKAGLTKRGIDPTPTGITNKMKLDIINNPALKVKVKDASCVKVYDVVLWFVDESGNRVMATAENFPEDGITVPLKYPEGTGKNTHNFVVAHMFAAGEKAGEIEYPSVTKTDSGIQFTVTSLSPIAVGWEAIPKVVPPINSDQSSSTAKPSPKTGDENAILLYSLFLILGAAGIGVAMKKRKGSRKR